MLVHSWVLSGEPQMKAFLKNRNSENKELEAQATSFLNTHKGIFEFKEHAISEGFKCINQRGDSNNIISLELSDDYKRFIRGKPAFMFGFAPRHNMIEVSNQEILRNFTVWEMRNLISEVKELRNKIRESLKYSYDYFVNQDRYIHANGCKYFTTLKMFMDKAYRGNTINMVYGKQFETLSEKEIIWLKGNMKPDNLNSILQIGKELKELSDAILHNLNGTDPIEAINDWIRNELAKPVDELHYDESQIVSSEEKEAKIFHSDGTFQVRLSKREVDIKKERKVVNIEVDEVKEAINYVHSKYSRKPYVRRYYVNPALLSKSDNRLNKLVEEHELPMCEYSTKYTKRTLFSKINIELCD